MRLRDTMARIRPVIVKEFRQIRRDKVSLAILLLIPAFLMFMIGYALNFDVKHVKLAFYDLDKTSASREFQRAFLNSEYFDSAGALIAYRDVDAMLGSGAASAVIVIPRDFSKDLLADKNVPLQVIIDGADSNTGTIALGYITRVIQAYSSQLTADFLDKHGMTPYQPVDLRPNIWYNPELASPKFLVPGFIGFILMLSAVVSTALSVVREKEHGTMEQLTLSPLNTLEIIIGKTVPHLLNSLISSVFVLLMARWLFGVPIRGEIIWLYSGIMLFLLAALGQGMMISVFANTQEVAFMMSVLSSILPTFLLSGLVFPIKSMPLALRVLSNVTPTKFFIIILRDVMLKGLGPRAYWHQLVYLSAFAAVTLGYSAVKMARQRKAV